MCPGSGVYSRFPAFAPCTCSCAVSGRPGFSLCHDETGQRQTRDRMMNELPCTESLGWPLFLAVLLLTCMLWNAFFNLSECKQLKSATAERKGKGQSLKFRYRSKFKSLQLVQDTLGDKHCGWAKEMVQWVKCLSHSIRTEVRTSEFM